MKHDMTTPCDECLFRTDRPTGAFPLRRADEIATALLNDQSFSCHKTTTNLDRDNYHPEAQHCAGAMIVLEKIQKPNQMMRIAERLGMYDHKKLDMAAPVYDTLEDFAYECMEADG